MPSSFGSSSQEKQISSQQSMLCRTALLRNSSIIVCSRFYSSFSASLIEYHKHFHKVWENNRAISAKQRSSREDVCRVHDNGKVWPLLNFHELQTEEFPDFSLLSKSPLKLNKFKMNQIILIMFCRNGGNTSLHQLSSENQYNYVVQAVLRSD